MDFVNAEWWQQNGLTVFLITLSLIQWVALQALIVHYHFYRKNMKKPRPDAVRMAIMEKTIALQSEQLEKIFGKLAQFNREIDALHIRQTPQSRTKPEVIGSLETSMASLGELNLKKRIQEIQSH